MAIKYVCDYCGAESIEPIYRLTIQMDKEHGHKDICDACTKTKLDIEKIIV
jgi:hypothetical protein